MDEQVFSLEPLGETMGTSVSDQLFRSLYRAILKLDLKPGMKLSELDVAKQVGLSRQPVREAFQRLAHLGFIAIKPQRATIVTPISEQVIDHAQFVRSAVEQEIVRSIVEHATEDDLHLLDECLKAQRQALDDERRHDFFDLDDAFHEQLCEISGHAHAWPIIRDQKAHVDRIRFLSAPENSEGGFGDHREIVRAIRARDPVGAAMAMDQHIFRHRLVMADVKTRHSAYICP